MELIGLVTKEQYASVVLGGDTSLTYKDALFFYAAFERLNEELETVREELQIAGTKKMADSLHAINTVVMNMEKLLNPVIMPIILPVNTIDVFNYAHTAEANSPDNQPTEQPVALGKIYLKKKERTVENGPNGYAEKGKADGEEQLSAEPTRQESTYQQDRNRN